MRTATDLLLEFLYGTAVVIVLSYWVRRCRFGRHI